MSLPNETKFVGIRSPKNTSPRKSPLNNLNNNSSSSSMRSALVIQQLQRNREVTEKPNNRPVTCQTKNGSTTVIERIPLMKAAYFPGRLERSRLDDPKKPLFSSFSRSKNFEPEVTCKFYRRLHEEALQREKEKRDKRQMKGFDPNTYVFEPILPNDSAFFPDLGHDAMASADYEEEIEKQKMMKRKHDENFSFSSDTNEVEASIEAEGKLRTLDNFYEKAEEKAKKIENEEDLFNFFMNSSKQKVNIQQTAPKHTPRNFKTMKMSQAERERASENMYYSDNTEKQQKNLLLDAELIPMNGNNENVMQNSGGNGQTSASPLQRSNSNLDLSPRKKEVDFNSNTRSRSVASNHPKSRIQFSDFQYIHEFVKELKEEEEIEEEMHFDEDEEDLELHFEEIEDDGLSHARSLARKLHAQKQQQNTKPKNINNGNQTPVDNTTKPNDAINNNIKKTFQIQNNTTLPQIMPKDSPLYSGGAFRPQTASGLIAGNSPNASTPNGTARRTGVSSSQATVRKYQVTKTFYLTKKERSSSPSRPFTATTMNRKETIAPNISTSHHATDALAGVDDEILELSKGNNTSLGKKRSSSPELRARQISRAGSIPISDKPRPHSKAQTQHPNPVPMKSPQNQPKASNRMMRISQEKYNIT